MNGKSSTDLKVSIDSPPVIPEKLQRAGYRFIRIIPKSKDPIDRDYPKTKNYSSEDSVIQNWISHYQSFEVKDRQNEGKFVHHEGHGNYGCLCSETRIAIDLDRQDIIEKALSHPLLNTSLSAQSGSGKGLHIWVKTAKAKTTKLSDPATKENIGHFKAAGGYVVGPSCIHPSGGLYHIVNDGEIPFISFEELLSFFSEYIQKRPEPVPVSHSYSNDTIDISIDRIMMPLKAVRSGSEIQGEHPVHGSAGGKNFSINIQKNVWRCWRCDSGGSSAEAIAVTHGLLDCSDAQPGCLRGDLFKAVLEIAEDEYGWIRPIKITPKKPEILPTKITSGDSFDIDFLFEPKKTDVLPEHLPPNVHVTLIDGYPRIGKTHWAELQAIKYQTANIIANTHSVIEQHLRIFRENRVAGQTAVHLEGRNRCCIFKDERRSCDHCSYYPYLSGSNSKERGQQRGRFLSLTVEKLHEKEIITKEEILKDAEISGYCPYFFLKECARISDYVFTVTENLEEITGDTHQTRHLTIIDEDTCFANFFPQSADLAEFIRGPSRNSVHSILETKWIGIQRWKNYITNGKKRPKGKQTILRMIEILEQIRDVLRIKDDEVFSPGQIIKDLNQIDTTVPDPDDITRSELIKFIERWEIQDTFSKFAHALLYPYKERLFAWQGYNPMKLRLIANEGTRIYDPPNTKMVLIGSTRAEMFLKTLDTTWEAIRINKFQYSKHFLFVIVKDDIKRGRSKRRTYKQNLLSALKRVAHVNSDTRYPLLVLVGTKKEQLGVIEELGGICKGSSDENIKGQHWNYMSGCFNIFYQNSVISRGVDIPFYKCLANLSSSFASPYWSARRDVALENRDNEDLEYCESIIDALAVDETTNSTLRITPVVNHTDQIPRVVIIGEHDLWKIKPGVLENAQIVELTSEQLFDNIEEVLDVTGRMEMLPAREGIVTDEEGKECEGSYWFATTYHDQPEIMFGKLIEERCQCLAEILKSKKEDTEPWRKRVNPRTIEEMEKQIIWYLIQRGEKDKKTSVGSLLKWIKTINRRMVSKDINNMIVSMYKHNKVRIDGIGLEAKVYLPSTYHEPEYPGAVKSETNFSHLDKKQ